MKRRIAIGLVIAVLAAGVLYTRSLRSPAQIPSMPTTRAPAPDLPYVTAIWNYAQGMAAVRGRRLDEADRYLAALTPIAEDPELAKLMVWDRYPLSHSARIEDSIPYDEPPGWHSPVRHALGETLLAAGKAAEAEAVYQEELRRNPENGWSLFGLARAMRAQGRERDALAVEQRFKAAWQHADVTLVASRF